MNFFKLIGQQMVNAALPGIKADLMRVLTERINGANPTLVPTDAKSYLLAIILSVVDAWTIKL